MLAEFIDKLSELARKAAGVQVVDVPQLRGVIVNDPDSAATATVQPYPPPWRMPELCGLKDVINLASDSEAAPNPEVYHDHSSIMVVLNRYDRWESATMSLEDSDRFKTLSVLSLQPKVLAPRDLVKLLRFDLHSTGIDPVIAALRKVDFMRKSDGRTDIQHGRESLGKSVEAAVQQADSVPEEFEVDCPVYSNPGLWGETHARIRCGLYLDVHEERIHLRVLADEISRAINTAQARIGELLRDGLPKVPIFHGHPDRKTSG